MFHRRGRQGSAVSIGSRRWQAESREAGGTAKAMAVDVNIKGVLWGIAAVLPAISDGLHQESDKIRVTCVNPGVSAC